MIRVSTLLFFISFWSEIAHTHTVRLATHNIEHLGYFETSVIKPIADDNFKGVAVDVVRCALAKIDYTPEIHVVPWARAQKMTKQNQVDGFFAASQNRERDSYATKSDTIAEQEWSWFYLNKAVLTPTHEDFRQQGIVGSFIGANMLRWLKSNDYNVGLEVKDSQTLFDGLMTGRVHAVLANKSVGNLIVEKNSWRSEIDSHVLMNKPLGVYFTHAFLQQHPRFLNQFNHAVASCR